MSEISGNTVFTFSLFRLFESEFPYHAFVLLLENILSAGDLPETEKLPFADRQFAEQRNFHPRFDGVKECAVVNIEFLIAASARAGVENFVGGFIFGVGITRIYFPEIGQQGNDLFVFLIDPTPRAVNFADFAPTEYFARIFFRQFHELKFKKYRPHNFRAEIKHSVN